MGTFLIPKNPFNIAAYEKQEQFPDLIFISSLTIIRTVTTTKIIEFILLTVLIVMLKAFSFALKLRYGLKI